LNLAWAMQTIAQKQKPAQQRAHLNIVMSGPVIRGVNCGADPSLHLQRALGNQALRRLLSANPGGLEADHGFSAVNRLAHDFGRVPVYARAPMEIQTKLKVNAPGDIYEQEADRIADRVMRKPDALIQRVCSCRGSSTTAEECVECKKEHEGTLQRAAVQSAPSGSAPQIVQDVLQSSGQPLDAHIRALFEPRFGYSFSHVRIHTNSRAAESARAVNALAYTVGRDVVMGAGQYSPGTTEGRRLLAHELTHVVQQSVDANPLPLRRISGTSTDGFERVAEGVAQLMETENHVDLALTAVQRRVSLGVLMRMPGDCPPGQVAEPEHTGICTEIKRESGELETFDALGPKVETISPLGCLLIRNLGSNGTRFGTPSELSDTADIVNVDPTISLRIKGYSDCKGTAAINSRLRLDRARAVADYFVRVLGVDTWRVTVDSVPLEQYVDTNSNPEGRARNRGVIIELVSIAIRHDEGCKPSHDTTFGPNTSNCSFYEGILPRRWLTWTYRHNATCACERTPDDRPNNCVRKCLQEKLSAFLSGLSGDAVIGTCLDPIGILDFACPEPFCRSIYEEHVDCYHECCCSSEFIGYPEFWTMCEAPFPCWFVGKTINWFNKCRLNGSS